MKRKSVFKAQMLNSIVCPKTKGPLIYNKKTNELVSNKGKIAYPIKNGIPILLVEKSRKL
tara:strand:- start:4078 stop:4257 length:180 start_codon:yes stop_codon:yes gene_type:complete